MNHLSRDNAQLSVRRLPSKEKVVVRARALAISLGSKRFFSHVVDKCYFLSIIVVSTIAEICG